MTSGEAIRRMRFQGTQITGFRNVYRGTFATRKIKMYYPLYFALVPKFTDDSILCFIHDLTTSIVDT